MTSAKLFILGGERELLWVYTNYYRYTLSDNSPASGIEGGLITLCFVTQENDDLFLQNMTKNVEKETDRMEKGEIHFYNKGNHDNPIRKYKFNDAYLVEFSEIFDADGTENMQTILTISPAIQNYGSNDDLVKHWQVSWLPPTEPVYYIPKGEEKDLRNYLSGYFYTKEGKYLGRIGTEDKVYITDQASFSEIEKGKKVSDDKIIYFTDKYGLNNTQMLDRANWVYVEGVGSVPFYYAYSIANSRKINSESKVYYYGMQEVQNKVTVHLDKDSYLSGRGTSQNKDNAAAFWKTRNNPDLRNASMISCISAVILSVHIPDKDPTDGCTGWLGYPDSGHRGAFQIKFSGRYHIFRIVGKSYGIAPLKTFEDYDKATKNIK
ncbi:type VI secretion system tube protein TssD [Flavobacterium artemisiae]|uniref:Type VI secretion system tube protein TssD n=1 Tax=Flavobacterium artemisiae TaxID=2126556 RepID=A0ABW4HH16_9FLAO